jgi:putative mycofactocin binding protein MftB
VTFASLDAFDASKHWQLSSDVSLRDEAFGALAYHHGNRRLVFLKSPTLVDLVRRLGDFSSADEAVAELVTPSERPRYLRALDSLYGSELFDAG